MKKFISAFNKVQQDFINRTKSGLLTIDEIKNFDEFQEEATEVINNYNKQPNSLQPKSLQPDSLQTNNFDTFWEAYDKKVGKPKAIKIWNKLKDSDRNDIINYIPKYIESKPDKLFRLNPDKFLANNSWLDEIIPINNSKKNNSSVNIDLNKIDYDNDK